MKRLFTLMFFIFSSFSLVFAKQAPVEFKDIPEVMQRLFEYHIEYKDLSPTLVRRIFKIYIEQFDPDRIFLMQDEVAPFLAISDAKAKKIIQKMKNGDFSDFLDMNRMYKKSMQRFEVLFERSKKEMLAQNDSQLIVISSYSTFPKTKNSLYLRTKQQLEKFLQIQKMRSVIDTKERKEKTYDLYASKKRRFHDPYLSNNEQDLAFLILKAFARSLDAHTAIFSEAEAVEMRMSLEKEFDGVGVVLTETIDGVAIADLIKNSPAEESGKIHINDILMEVNGRNISGQSFDEVLDAMKAEQKKMKLGFCRIDKKTFRKGPIWHVSLERRPISMDEERLTYSYEKFDDGIIAKLNLPSFYENAGGISSEKDIKDALRQLEKKGPIKGIVLDLRENAGGFLSQAIKVVGLFISNGVVVISKAADHQERYLRSMSNKAYYSGPLVLLTSKLSASASEIVAQALQDFGVALIIGDERTFGKGSIQYQTVTDEDADLFYKITVGKYYTVSGKTTQITGVKADIVVPTAFSPYHIGERYLEYPLQPDQVAAAYHDNLKDLDGRAKKWFEKNYLPNLQRKVSYWHKLVPLLKENSYKRIVNDPDMQLFIEKMKQISAKINGLPYNESILMKDFGNKDLQMNEAVNVVKDMIFIENRMPQHGKFSLAG